MKKSMYQTLMSFALMGAMFDSDSGRRFSQELTPADLEYFKELAKRKQKEIKLQTGCKEFTIDGITVIALNEKNAIRKVNAIKKQLL